MVEICSLSEARSNGTLTLIRILSAALSLNGLPFTQIDLKNSNNHFWLTFGNNVVLTRVSPPQNFLLASVAFGRSALGFDVR